MSPLKHISISIMVASPTVSCLLKMKKFAVVRSVNSLISAIFENDFRT
ncbi:hypothetical protein HMPREF1869_00469 [Bacteroidales bacterium KA00251]|nr:hypothetical protein HMPREF1869_00469 [Bacteroidales bacterium KA00251]